MTKAAGKGGGGHRVGAVLIVAIGKLYAAFGGMFAPQQANTVDHAGQTAHRISAARIAKQENPVALAVVAGKPAIGAADLSVQPAPLDNRHHLFPALPLQPLLVVDRAMGFLTVFDQQLVKQATIAFLARRQGRERAIQNDDMIDSAARPPRFGRCGRRSLGAGFAAPPRAKTVKQRQPVPPATTPRSARA